MHIRAVSEAHHHPPLATMGQKEQKGRHVRASRSATAINDILEHIITGRFPANTPLPAEADLADILQVSRPTMREAVSILRERGVLDVRQGSGTFVRPHDEWTDVPTIMRAISQDMSPRDVGLRLVEVRRMLEVGAAGLAATNRTNADLVLMDQTHREYCHASKRERIENCAHLDIQFHNAILTASGNPFLAPILTPFAQALYESRLETTRNRDARIRAIDCHSAILQAIDRKDATEAKQAMRRHMTETRNAFEDLDP